MMATGEQGESTWDVEALLGDVLRPIEPPERLSGRIEDPFAPDALRLLGEWVTQQIR